MSTLLTFIRAKLGGFKVRSRAYAHVEAQRCEIYLVIIFGFISIVKFSGSRYKRERLISPWYSVF